jgi:hypothetical protein
VPIETAHQQGWAWFELESIDPAGGANRAERDAFRLAAVMLSHWDNKASNQRLICLAPAPSAAGPCPKPFALINDLGATFGPNKVDLDAWRAVPIWTDRSQCTVSMKAFPYGGSTFRDATISEAGRQLMVRQLNALSESQVAALFSGARFPDEARRNNTGDSPGRWAAAFVEKARQIREGRPCPS